MNEDQIRLDFEEFVLSQLKLSRYCIQRKRDGEYRMSLIRDKWDTWQSAANKYGAKEAGSETS